MKSLTTNLFFNRGAYMDLSIIVVNYMTYEKTVNTISSIFMYTRGVDYEVILVDNGSKNNDSLKLGKYIKDNNLKVKYIQNKENLGFSKGNNIGIKKSKGQYIALLNSDTELTENSFNKAVTYLKDNKNVGALGCRLITPDGKLDHGCKRGFPTPEASIYYILKLDKFFKNNIKYGAYRLSYLNEHEINDVDVISGAFFVTTRKVLDKVGLLDERFFMYGEDIDLCFRIKENGYRIVYNPTIGTVIHYKGSSGKKRRLKTIYNFYEAMILFYNKHYRKKYNPVVTIIVYLSVGVLFITKALKNIFKRD